MGGYLGKTLALDEIAKYLKIVPLWRDTLYKMAGEGEIPDVKINLKEL